MEKAVIVTIRHEREDSRWGIEDLLAELRELVVSSGVGIAGEIVARCSEFSPKYLVGKGKVEGILQVAEAEDA